MSTIAGLAAFGRSASVLLADGELIAAAPEESFTRRKNDPAFPERAFLWCCERAGLEPNNLDYLVFAEKPVQRFVRLLGSIATGFPRTITTFPATLTTWLGNRLWLKAEILRRLPVAADRVLFLERTVAQIASAFLTSPFPNAAILIVDGTGEWAATTIAMGRTSATGSAELESLVEIEQPHALTALQDAVRHHLQLPDVGGLRWLAPLAAYGEATYLNALSKLVPAQQGGAYALDRSYFQLDAGVPRFARRAWPLIGEPRGPGEPLPVDSTPADPAARRFANLARSAQVVIAERCLALVQEAKRRTGADQLCLGGSLFLDPTLAAHILREAPFAQVHIDPWLDDAGAALGAALYVTHVVEGRPRSFPGGRRHREHERRLEPVVVVDPFAATQLGDRELAAAAARALAQGQIVAWVDAVPELEARPTGRCVLLCDAAREDVLLRLRREVKLAERWVPFALLAPAALLETWCPERTRRAAALGQITVTPPASVADAIRGVVHVDGSVLARAANPAECPGLCRLLEEFHELSGRAFLAMSSFNRAGEPPVLRLSEALDLVRRSGIDVLFWGDCEVRVKAQ